MLLAGHITQAMHFVSETCIRRKTFAPSKFGGGGASSTAWPAGLQAVHLGGDFGHNGCVPVEGKAEPSHRKPGKTHLATIPTLFERQPPPPPPPLGGRLTQFGLLGWLKGGSRSKTIG